MARIGVLGDIVFETSSDRIMTLTTMTWSGSAEIATHVRHNNDALTEFTSRGADGITMSIDLCAWLGTDPMDELTKIWTYMREGRSLPLTIGDHAYGRYRWLIVNHSDEVKHFDKTGCLYMVTVSLTLIEYLRG